MDNLHHGDCLEVMATFEPESIDAIVTDPPYGLEFMGKSWDKIRAPSAHPLNQKKGMTAAGEPEKGNPWCGGYPFSGSKTCQCDKPDWDTRTAEYARTMQDWHEAWAREAFRIAKPGAHLLAFGGTRTYHRLASAIEDAGWEIRDTLVWAYASGFPKSLDVSKAIDKAAGAERERYERPAFGGTFSDDGGTTYGTAISAAPATPDAEKWNGWGTALKPAWEPIVLARKPLRGTVAANVLAHGTGALNIDGTRIGMSADDLAAYETKQQSFSGAENTEGYGGFIPQTMPHERMNGGGRWPANVILTDPIFDGGVDGVVGGGEAGGGFGVRGLSGHIYGGGNGFTDATGETVGYGDSGTYSRFFLIPKSARSEREPVLGGPVDDYEHSGPRGHGLNGDGTPRPRSNVHPTVKPLDLMRHLVRLVTPPGGTVLDPFLGSGTTALAAEMEGFAWIGIEKEAEYVAITEARLNGVQKGLGLVG